jgi:hypothetical protein
MVSWIWIPVSILLFCARPSCGHRLAGRHVCAGPQRSGRWPTGAGPGQCTSCRKSGTIPVNGRPPTPPRTGRSRRYAGLLRAGTSGSGGVDRWAGAGCTDIRKRRNEFSLGEALP